MITGTHTIIYSAAADEARTALADMLDLSGVDIGGGWLVFALPPAELAVHPIDEDPRGDISGRVELYLLCDDITSTVAELQEKGLETGPVSDEGWGILTNLKLPGGVEVGLYEPRHPTAFSQG